MAQVKIQSEEHLYTIKQVSHLTTIPVSTIRRYCREYKSHFRLHKGLKNSNLYSREQIDNLLIIKQMKQMSKQEEEIRACLDEKIKEQEEQKTTETALCETRETTSMQQKQFQKMSQMMERIYSQNEEMAVMIQTLKQENAGLRQDISGIQTSFMFVQSQIDEIRKPKGLKRLWNHLKELCKRKQNP